MFNEEAKSISVRDIGEILRARVEKASLAYRPVWCTDVGHHLNRHERWASLK